MKLLEKSWSQWRKSFLSSSKISLKALFSVKICNQNDRLQALLHWRKSFLSGSKISLKASFSVKLCNQNDRLQALFHWGKSFLSGSKIFLKASFSVKICNQNDLAFEANKVGSDSRYLIFVLRMPNQSAKGTITYTCSKCLWQIFQTQAEESRFLSSFQISEIVSSKSKIIDEVWCLEMRLALWFRSKSLLLTNLRRFDRLLLKFFSHISGLKKIKFLVIRVTLLLSLGCQIKVPKVSS